jgi:phosphosulfolactate synthase
MLTYHLPHIPARTQKARETGLTMVMDKGLSLRQAEDLIASAGDYIDLLKLGFGTALLTKNLKEKIKLYQDAGIDPYLGGTLFEVFAVRDKFDDYRKFISNNNLQVVEVSDGSMKMKHEDKLQYINVLKKEWKVLSEVGTKQAGVEIPSEQWIQMMKNEYEAGSWKVITEARESGTIGIYNTDGTANIDLIDDIIVNLNPDNILWEAPVKKQQVWFIKLLGTNVNLGNIATTDIIPLETLRRGLRGDTFFDFLPENYKS